MATIKSKQVSISTSADKVYTFLQDLNNLEGLMPSDRIQNWESDTNTCSFTIKGLAGIGMKLDEGAEFSQVKIISHGKNPFDFELFVNIDDQGDSCQAELTFEANMNFMIQTMASGPLTNLFNMMADQLVKRFS